MPAMFPDDVEARPFCYRLLRPRSLLQSVTRIPPVAAAGDSCWSDMEPSPYILIVDGEWGIRDLLLRILVKNGCRAATNRHRPGDRPDHPNHDAAAKRQVLKRNDAAFSWEARRQPEMGVSSQRGDDPGDREGVGGAVVTSIVAAGVAAGRLEFGC